MKILKNKRLIYFGYLIIGLIIIALGGAKLLVYLGLLVTGLFLGWKLKGINQLYADYKLGLRINSLQYSQKQHEEMKSKLEQYEKEIATAAERIKLYQAAQTKNTSSIGGLTFNDNIHRNGIAGVRQDAETD